MSKDNNKNKRVINESEEIEVVNWKVVIPLLTIMVAVFVAAFLLIIY